MLLEVSYRGERVDIHDIEVTWKDIYGIVRRGSIISYGESCALDEADRLEDMM